MTANEVVAIYPELFESVLREGSLESYGLGVGKGWHPLIAKLVREIREVDEELGVKSRVAQIKEKFGGLRFYLEETHTAHYEMISRAENASYDTCEMCGREGKMYNDGWMQTLCRPHAQERWRNRAPRKAELTWERCWRHDSVNNSEEVPKN